MMGVHPGRKCDSPPGYSAAGRSARLRSGSGVVCMPESAKGMVAARLCHGTIARDSSLLPAAGQNPSWSSKRTHAVRSLLIAAAISCPAPSGDRSAKLMTFRPMQKDLVSEVYFTTNGHRHMCTGTGTGTSTYRRTQAHASVAPDGRQRKEHISIPIPRRYSSSTIYFCVLGIASMLGNSCGSWVHLGCAMNVNIDLYSRVRGQG